ncbi:MAG TPA: hypothetical protein DCS82_10840 [Rhodospirillaceae bacterium]|nr:hypothetical protein [Rhodospirillaceae bacterium]HAA91225.1 hypothetical protein [Rhodospirillaceae bacterium]HAT36204.1 hypothetical protein [Rhodospirillaceae bacterium]
MPLAPNAMNAPQATNIERKLEGLFRVPVLVTRVPNGPELNEAMINELDQIREETPNGKPSSWACDVYTTISNNCALHERPAFQEFNDAVMQCLTKYGELMAYPLAENDLRITQCWVNIYQQGMSQEIHNHANHIMTGVYYVKAPPNCSKIMFHSYNADTMIRPPIERDTPYNTTIAAYSPEPGDLVIFDSALRHSVPVNEAEGERISVSFNATL